MTADWLWRDQVTAPDCRCGHTAPAHYVLTARGLDGRLIPTGCQLMCCDCPGWRGEDPTIDP